MLLEVRKGLELGYGAMLAMGNPRCEHSAEHGTKGVKPASHKRGSCIDMLGSNSTSCMCLHVLSATLRASNGVSSSESRRWPDGSKSLASAGPNMSCDFRDPEYYDYYYDYGYDCSNNHYLILSIITRGRVEDVETALDLRLLYAFKVWSAETHKTTHTPWL